MVLQQLRSMWMSVARITTGAQAHHVLGHLLKYKGPAKLSPLHPHCPVVTWLPAGDLTLNLPGHGIMDTDDPGKGKLAPSLMGELDSTLGKVHPTPPQGTPPLTWKGWSPWPGLASSVASEAHIKFGIGTPTPTSIPPMACWRVWRDWSCGTIGLGSLWLEATAGYQRGM